MINGKRKQNKGFTLAELLIVVAIIGILVAISIPIFSTQLEKARRTVDIANARSIESALATMVNDGTIEIGENHKGIWVYVQRTDENRQQKEYKGITFYIGADYGVYVDGKELTEKDDPIWKNNKFIQNENLYEKIEACFGKGGVQVHCGNPAIKINGVGGWDWYIVEIYKDDYELSA